jgi:Mn2+/Fe2+ NRAMP family transporter
LQAGSDFGYKLLFVVLLAGAFAVILQVNFFVFITTLLGDPHPFFEGISM